MGEQSRAAKTRLLHFRGLSAWRAEVCEVEFGPLSLRASGTQLGIDPLPYRMDFELETDSNFVTRRLRVTAKGEGWGRRIELHRPGARGWVCYAEARGSDALPAPGGELAPLAGALDCDVGWSPLTNVMPIRRLNLHRAPGSCDLIVVWVAVPQLSVHRSEQRYEHLRVTNEGAVVRYVGAHRGYEGELVVDHDGLVLHYPDLASRVAGLRDRR